MLTTRSTEPEQLDNLELSGEALERTLSGLSFINKLLGNTSATLKAVKKEIKQSDKPLKIIDLGCGGGDSLRAIASWCDSKKRSVDLLGIDGNAHTLAYARQQTVSVVPITYVQADILDPDFMLPNCDVLISSHFVYHFSDDAIVSFLEKSKNSISNNIIFNELERNSAAYILFKIGISVFPFSKMVKEDGLLAIKRSFTKREFRRILERSEISGYQIRSKWAFRLLVRIPM